MNVNIPEDLAAKITALAKRDRIFVEEAVRQAIDWFVNEDDELWNDFKRGEIASAEALALVERLAAEEADQ